MTKNYPAQKVNSAKVEKPCSITTSVIPPTFYGLEGENLFLNSYI